MSGDYSNAARVVNWGTSIQTQDEEIILPGGSVSTAIYQRVPDSNDWAFNGDFCIEIFGAKFASDTAHYGLISHYQATGNQRSWSFNWDGSGSPDNFHLYLTTDGTATGSNYQEVISSAWTPTPDQPYNICAERASNTLRFYVDGSMLSSHALTIGAALFNSSQQLEIGLGFQKTSNPWAGRYKALRITRAARYANNGGYVVPTLPLPTHGSS